MAWAKVINWIQIHGFRNTELIQRVCQHFNVDFLTMQDILNSNHQAKIELHDTYNVVILKLLSFNDGAYVPQQIAIVQGDGFLLTFIEKETDFLTDIKAALEKNVLKIRNRQSDFLLSVILNSVMAVSCLSFRSWRTGWRIWRNGCSHRRRPMCPALKAYSSTAAISA